MCSRSNFEKPCSRGTTSIPTSWDPYPRWQTQCQSDFLAQNQENFVQDSRCCDSTNFNLLGTAWTPDKTNYVPDMNRNMALSLQRFKKY